MVRFIKKLALHCQNFQIFFLILQVPIIIYQPKVVPKHVPTCSSILEHGAEAFYLDDEDVGKDEQDPNYFPIKLAYNKVHHYMPIVPENILNYLETYNNATYYTRQAREALKSFRNTLPHDSNYYKLVDCAYTAAINTTTVLSGCNIISGTTGTAGATSAAEVFNFPSVESGSSKKKRKTAVAPTAPLPSLSSAPGSSTQAQA